MSQFLKQQPCPIKAKKQRLLKQIQYSSQFANSENPRNSGIMRLESQIQHRKFWQELVLPILQLKLNVSDLQEKDVICEYISEIDNFLYFGANTFKVVTFEDLMNKKTNLNDYFFKRNTLQEERLQRQFVRFLKLLKKDLQRQLNFTKESLFEENKITHMILIYNSKTQYETVVKTFTLKDEEKDQSILEDYRNKVLNAHESVRLVKVFKA